MSMDLSGVKQMYQDGLVGLYSVSEIKQLVKSILCKRLELSDSDYILGDHNQISPEDQGYFAEVLTRLRSGEPFQYILGSVFFAELDLLIDSRALIPRPETEELVYWIAEDYADGSPIKIIDVCTGSGCIALGLKNFINQAEVLGVDASKEAISLANENAAVTGLDVSFFMADVLDDEWMRGKVDGKFDVWVSNPPYVPEKDKAIMEDNVLSHEPHMALFVKDKDPLLFYRVIAQKARDNLKAGGALYFEIHEDLAGEVEDLLEEQGFVNIEVRKDLQGKDRMVKCFK